MSRLSKIFGYSLVAFCVVLTGCGGAPNDNPNYLERVGGTPTTRTITVTVSGASGTVVITLAGQELTFEENGSRDVAGLSLSDTIEASIISTPESDQCSFFPSNQQQITVASAVLVECGAPSISGVLKNFFTDEVVANASIRVTSLVDTSYVEFVSVNSGTNGGYEVTGVVPGERYVLTVTADGFAPQTTIALPTTERAVVIENIFLVPENAIVTLDPSADMVFTVDGLAVLEIPANGLVNSADGPPVGNVSARISMLEPSSAPRALTGWYESLSGATVGNIESFGGLAVTLTDSEGTPMELADAVVATVRVPVATSALNSSPASSTLYLFDKDAGYWQTTFDAAMAGIGGVSVYESSVTLLADTFTVGQEYSPVSVQGCIEDSRGNRIAGATIVSQGSSYIGLAFGVSDAQGDFTVPAQPESEVFVYGLVGSQSRTASVTTTTSTAVLDACILLDQTSTTISLTWGENPNDLDSQLFGPASSDNTNERFRLYFANGIVEVNGVTIFLDVDNTSGFGPEVTTIPAFPLAGTYEFFVDRFSGSSTIQSSPARVEINVQGQNFAFSPAEGAPTDCWHVFNIVVDSSLSGNVVPVNAWVSDDACSTGLFNNTVSDNGQSQLKTSPAQQAIERKYYVR